MKILIISQYFWPENFRINEVVKFFTSSGYEVEVLTGEPNYPGGEIYKNYLSEPDKYKEYFGAKVYRLNAIPRKRGSKLDLFINYSSFLYKSIYFSLRKLRKKNYDIIFTFGTSPVTTSITSIILSKFTGSKTAIWVLDLWPDIVFELNIIKNKFLKKKFSNLMESIYRKTDLILAQSFKFKQNISEKIHNDDKVKVLYQWPEVLENIGEDRNSEINFEQKDLNIVFTGNIGTAQNFEHVIKVANACENLNVKWHIIGTGRDLNNIVSLSRISKKILFYGLRDKSEMLNFLNKADVLLISLREGNAINSTIPGKLQTYLLANKPILGSISGEAAKIISENKIGLVSNPGDEKFISNIKTFYELKTQKKLQVNTSELIKLFDKDKILNQLNNDLVKLVKQKNVYLNMIKSVEDIDFSRNFILSAINLAFLGYYGCGKIKVNTNSIFGQMEYILVNYIKKKI